jgi:hypothetical protein
MSVRMMLAEAFLMWLCPTRHTFRRHSSRPSTLSPRCFSLCIELTAIIIDRSQDTSVALRLMAVRMASTLSGFCSGERLPCSADRRGWPLRVHELGSHRQQRALDRA